MDITQLLAFSVKNKASDLHLSAGLPPMIRVDGDVRRMISKKISFEDKAVREVMTKNPLTIDENVSLAQAVEWMQKKEITSFAVVDEQNRLKGYIHLHDILGRGGSVNISLNQP